MNHPVTPESCSKAALARPGRPPNPAKQTAILIAARDVFFAKGFNGATIEEIAAHANVSKVTIYKHFADKESLFEAVVRAQSLRMVAAFDIGGVTGADLEQRLNAFGVALLSFLFDAEHVSLDRILAQEFVQMPELAQRFFLAGPNNCRMRLAAVLRDAEAAGAIATDDPITAAEDLFGIWQGFADIELKFGLIQGLDPAAIGARVARGTRRFLKAYRPD